MPLPNALYIGLPRSGSTWLHHHLGRHPEIFVPVAKDVDYLDRHAHRGLAWYEAHFAGAGSAPIRLDISHDYMFSPTAARRASELLGSPRIVMGIREPISFAVSTLTNARRHGVNTVGERLLTDSGRLLAGGIYDRFAQLWIERFGLESVHVYRFDHLRSDPLGVYSGIVEHLGVANLGGPELATPINEAGRPRFGWLTKVAKSGAAAAHDAGRTALVAKVKRNPAVQRALYRPAGQAPATLPEHDAELRALFRPSVERLAALIGDDTLVGDWGYA